MPAGPNSIEKSEIDRFLWSYGCGAERDTLPLSHNHCCELAAIKLTSHLVASFSDGNWN